MTTRILDKTDKGREEIATRKYRLTPRLRTLLVLIDGKNDEGNLLKKVSGLGLSEESITELLSNGFIHTIGLSSAHKTTGAAETAAELNSVSIPGLTAGDSSLLSASESIPLTPLSGGGASAQATQFQALYNFFTETIKSTIGLRGYGLQLKVERASSIDDFRELRQLYVDAVLKARGSEMARSLSDRLDQLLNSGQ
jgi:hypothetical protein